MPSVDNDSMASRKSSYESPDARRTRCAVEFSANSVIALRILVAIAVCAARLRATRSARLPGSESLEDGAVEDSASSRANSGCPLERRAIRSRSCEEIIRLWADAVAPASSCDAMSDSGFSVRRRIPAPAVPCGRRGRRRCCPAATTVQRELPEDESSVARIPTDRSSAR